MSKTGSALDVFPAFWGPRVWIVGAHGGAGESTLAALDEGFAATNHRWPTIEDDDPSNLVLVVARTHAHGLACAARVLGQWASGDLPGLPLELLGLVLIEDAPGKLPRELADQVRISAGGAPRSWLVGFSPDIRVGLRPDPKVFSAVLAGINQAVTTASMKGQQR